MSKKESEGIIIPASYDTGPSFYERFPNTPFADEIRRAVDIPFLRLCSRITSCVLQN